MEGSEDVSENDMSFELTGPLHIVPFEHPLNRSSKRDFATFADDPTFQPEEQNDPPAFGSSVIQETVAADGYTSEHSRQLQISSWVHWGIFRSLEAIQFTSNVLQAVYAATLIAAMPVAAAKRRLVSIAPQVPTPAPLRRILSSRRNLPRIFRQDSSPSPGHRAITPLKPPKFRPKASEPESPYHIPGSYPVSPVATPRPVIPRPFMYNINAGAAILSLEAPNTPSNTADSSAICSPTIPNSSSSGSFNTGGSLAVASVDVPTFSSNTILEDMTLSDDGSMDESTMPVRDQLSPLQVKTVALDVNQSAQFNDLDIIRGTFGKFEPKQYSISPKVLMNTLEPDICESDDLIKLGSSLLETAEQQRSEAIGSVALGKSSASSSEQQSLEHSGSVEAQESSLKTSDENLSEHSRSIESNRSPLQTTREQSPTHDESIDSTRSSFENPEQQTSGLNALVESTTPSLSTSELQRSRPDGLIESPRTPSHTPQEQPSATDGLIASSRSPPYASIEQISMTDKLIESPRTFSGISTQRGQTNTILKTPKIRSPEEGLFSKLLSGLKSKKRRASPLKETINSANAFPKTPRNKNARFDANPVTKTRKYVKGEAISYPSPHSSRDENSILSRSPSMNISSISPTQEEQEAMLANQLSCSTLGMFMHDIGADCTDSDFALDSSPVNDHESMMTDQTSNSMPDISVITEAAESPESGFASPTDPSTPPNDIDNQFKGLNVSGRRSSGRLQEKVGLAEKNRREQEALAAEEEARNARAEAEEKARIEAEAEEKARAEAEEIARLQAEAKERARTEEEERARLQAEAEEERRRTTLRMPIDSVIQPLTQEWENTIADKLAHAPRFEVAQTKSGGEISRRDIGMVLPQHGTTDSSNGWLNDTIIDAYFQLIVTHVNEAAGLNRRGVTPKIHAFSNFFYNKLRDQGADQVKRWSSRAKVGGKNLLKVEWVFIPVNVHGSHWTLIAISPTRKTIEYYDSLHGSAMHQIRNIKAWLKGELGNDYKDEEWKVVEDPTRPGKGKGPTQSNGSDCGVFTVTTAKMISLGVDPMAVSASDMPTQRKRLVAELINGGFTGDFAPNIRFE